MLEKYRDLGTARRLLSALARSTHSPPSDLHSDNFPALPATHLVAERNSLGPARPGPVPAISSRPPSGTTPFKSISSQGERSSDSNGK